MQTKQTTGPRCAASDYVTIVEQASAKISGFDELYKEMERSISVSGKKFIGMYCYRRYNSGIKVYCIMRQEITMLYLKKNKYKDPF